MAVPRGRARGQATVAARGHGDQRRCVGSAAGAPADGCVGTPCGIMSATCTPHPAIRPSTPFAPSTRSAAAYRAGTSGSARPSRGRALKAIERRWGWRDLLADAIGGQTNQAGSSWEAVLDDRAQIMLAALRAARDELGRWPTREEWDRSGGRPASRTFVRYFG